MVSTPRLGGGSKDTWVLRRPAPPARTAASPRRVVAAAAARPACARRLGHSQQQSSSRATVHAGSPTSCTGSAARGAREHTAAHVDGLFHEDCRAAAADTAGVRAELGIDDS
jgi:hypothetical protein